jgi:DnaK suppressor protein
MEKRRPRGRPNPGGTRPKASTENIVGQKRVREHIPARWRKYYQRLQELHDQFLRQQSVLAKDAIEEQPVFSSHVADAGTDSYDRDFALGILSAEQDAIYEIEEALDRIRNGTYGRCELTGKPIEQARLEAIPWTRFSAPAERQVEKEGGAKTARLGPREHVSRTKPQETNEETD